MASLIVTVGEFCGAIIPEAVTERSTSSGGISKAGVPKKNEVGRMHEMLHELLHELSLAHTMYHALELCGKFYAPTFENQKLLLTTPQDIIKVAPIDRLSTESLQRPLSLIQLAPNPTALPGQVRLHSLLMDAGKGLQHLKYHASFTVHTPKYIVATALAMQAQLNMMTGTQVVNLAK